MASSDHFEPLNFGFTFLQLTPDEEIAPTCIEEQEYKTDDGTADLAILSVLAPEFTNCSSNGQGQCLESEISMFCPELGVFTEEPEDIDPDFDYEADAVARGVFKKERKLHIDLDDDAVPELVKESESAVSSGCFVDTPYASRIDALCMYDRVDGTACCQHNKVDPSAYAQQPFTFQPLIV
jgi:hypothetical protein